MFLTKDKSFYQSFIRLSVALMFQQAVVLSVNLADNVMLGSYSEIALSGVAAVNQVQFILQQLVYSVSNGMIVLTSQYWGQRKKEPIRKLLSIAFRFAVIIAFVLFVIVSLFPQQVIGLFTNDGAIVEQGCAYLNIVRFTYLFFAVTTVLLGGMRTVEKVNIALYVSIVALVVNCSINYVLIKGRFGFPEMGVEGAAIGTLTARILEFVIVSVYVLYKDECLRLRIRDLLGLDHTLLSDYVCNSLPVVVTGFLWGLNTALQTVILGHMSSNAIAAHSISSTIFLFLKVTSVGASSAASVLTGKTVGAGNMEKIKEYTRTLQVLFICIGATLCVILLVIRVPFLSLYNLSEETYRLANIFMIIEATVLLFMSYQMCTNTGIISGGGNPRFVVILDIIVIWGMVIPMSFAAAFWWNASPIIVLLLLNADQYLKGIPAVIYCNSYRWVRNLTREDGENA